MFLISIQAPGLLVTLTTSKNLKSSDISNVFSKLHGYIPDNSNILLQ